MKPIMPLVDPDHMQNFEIGIRYVTGGSGGRALDLDLGTGGAGEPGRNRGRGGEQLRFVRSQWHTCNLFD